MPLEDRVRAPEPSPPPDLGPQAVAIGEQQITNPTNTAEVMQAALLGQVNPILATGSQEGEFGPSHVCTAGKLDGDSTASNLGEKSRGKASHSAQRKLAVNRLQELIQV